MHGTSVGVSACACRRCDEYTAVGARIGCERTCVGSLRRVRLDVMIDVVFDGGCGAEGVRWCRLEWMGIRRRIAMMTGCFGCHVMNRALCTS